MGSKLSLSLTLSTPLGSKRSTLPSVQPSPREEMKQSRSIKLENSMRTKKRHNLEKLSASNPKSRDMIEKNVFY